MKELLIPMFFFLSPCLFAQEDALIPQFAVGGGYQTNLLVTNLGGSGYDQIPWYAEVGVYPSSFINNNHALTDLSTIRVNGDPLVNGRFVVSLKFRETQKYVITTTGDAMITGALTINCYGFSSLSYASLSCFYNFYADGKLMNTTAVPISGGGRGFGFTVEKTNRVNIGVAWMTSGFPNIGSLLPQLTIYLFSSDGSLFSAKTFYAPSYAAQFIDQIFASIPQDFIGFISIYVDSVSPKIALMVLRMGKNADQSFLFTSVPLSR